MGEQNRVSGVLRWLTNSRIHRTAIREAVGWGVALAAYPLGVLDEAVEHAPLRTHAPHPVRNPRFHENPGAYDVPVFLIHGYAHNHSGYWLLKNRLRRVGFTHVYTLNYNPWLHDVPAVAKRLERRVENVCSATGQPYVHVVGHSMGGVASRYYVQKLSGAERVHRVIMIGSPQNGTFSASALAFLGRTARQLGWESGLFRELNSLPADRSVRFTSVWSSGDELVVPAESARLCPVTFNAENVHVRGEGHLSLLLSSRVIEIVIDRLCDIDSVPKLKTETAVPVVRREVAATSESLAEFS